MGLRMENLNLLLTSRNLLCLNSSMISPSLLHLMNQLIRSEEEMKNFTFLPSRLKKPQFLESVKPSTLCLGFLRTLFRNLKRKRGKEEQEIMKQNVLKKRKNSVKENLTMKSLRQRILTTVLSALSITKPFQSVLPLRLLTTQLINHS